MPRIRIIVLLAIVAYLLTGFTQVGPEERAVVRRFGAVVARPGPGLFIGLPWGMDRVDLVPVRTVRQIPVGYNPEAWSDIPGTPTGQWLTGDQNLVNIQLVLDYAIGEADSDLDDFVMHRDQVDVVLTREAEAAAAAWAGGRGVDEVLLTGNAALPAWVLVRLPARVQDNCLGIRVQRVSVGYLAPPEEVRPKFEEVNQAQTMIRTRENQARQEAEQRLQQAAAMKYKLEQEAQVSRASQLRQAQAEAAAFRTQLAAFRELRAVNPDALAMMWWTEMRKTLTSLKARGGRVEPLDSFIGPDGLDITQVVTPKRR